MSEPTFSIITVCLNAAATIRHTLDSVHRQTYPAARIQHVVMDGSSTDGTQAMLAAAHQAGRVAVWRSAPDHGVYDAMNQGLALATGECVAFLNADDWYAPDALAHVATAWAHARPDYLFCDAFQVDGQGLHPRLVPARLGHIISGMPYCHQSLFCSRDWLNRLGGFDTSFRVAGDYDLAWRLLAAGAKPCHLRRPLVYSRLGGLCQQVPHTHELFRVLERNVDTLTRLLSAADRDRFIARLVRAIVRRHRSYAPADRRAVFDAMDRLAHGLPGQGGWHRWSAELALQICHRHPTAPPIWVSPLIRLALAGSHRPHVDIGVPAA